MRIAAVAKALPPHYFDQQTLAEALREHWRRHNASPRNLERLEALHEKVLVGGRHLSLPLEGYDALESFGAANNVWIEVAQQLGQQAIQDALRAARVPAEAVGALLFVSVTGMSTPSIDARLMNRLPLPAKTKRMPIFGLGCVAGAAGLARAADYVKAYPGEAAILLSVELCSLTLQRHDLSIANLIASGLFGDGAAAVVVTGDELSADGPRILDTRSSFYPNTEHVMGWTVDQSGFRVVLSPEVPEMVHRHLRRDVDAFLDEHGLTRRDIASWVCHPGGPRVIEAMLEALELPPEALELTWRSLREVGNLSSTSVLFILADTIATRRPPPESLGMLLAMGPGFCSELVLLEW